MFCGPVKSAFHSKDVLAKKIATEKRCEKLRALSADGIVSWAIAYPSASWSSGTMGQDAFSSLVDSIEPRTQAWPPMVLKSLQELQSTEIRGNQAFDTLVQSLSELSRHDLPQERVVSRQTVNPVDEPNKRNRETKDMFAEAPITNVMRHLPQPFVKAVQNSQQWKWERSSGFDTTSCLATLFPRSEKDDVSFTIWVGHNDGYRLNNIFGVTSSFS
ncbi:hypothetical protein AK830_g982 [Neonectria ditissima]|uniref:Uncharacterized protein n=1 Tax=Neonectria ditissima TaxID=78410 RepID=A0A0P7BV68_9HYPO|nr:hypothetical protein AK830_g982 [Neonectria ditissima]